MIYVMGVILGGFVLAALWWVLSRPDGIRILAVFSAGVLALQGFRWMSDGQAFLVIFVINATAVGVFLYAAWFNAQFDDETIKMWLAVFCVLVFFIWSVATFRFEALQARKQHLEDTPAETMKGDPI